MLKVHSTKIFQVTSTTMYRVNPQEQAGRAKKRPGFRPLKVATRIMAEALRVKTGQATRAWPKKELSSRISEMVTRSLVMDSHSNYGIVGAPELQAITTQLATVWSSPPGSEGKCASVE